MVQLKAKAILCFITSALWFVSRTVEIAEDQEATLCSSKASFSSSGSSLRSSNDSGTSKQSAPGLTRAGVSAINYANFDFNAQVLYVMQV